MTLKRRISGIVAVVVLIASLLVIAGYYKEVYEQDVQTKKLEGINLVKLHEKYPDIIGWIKIDGTKISYPVMKGEKYLRKNFKGEYSLAGTPFIRNYDFYSQNTLIFGHNMNYDRRMFYQLPEYEDKFFWGKHQFAEFYAIDGKYCEKRVYRVFSAVKTDTKDWQYPLYENAIETLDKYKRECIEKSLYETDVRPLHNLLTLSTCSYHSEDGRFVIIGTLVKKEECNRVKR